MRSWFLIFVFLFSYLDAKSYQLTNDPIDIVIPCCGKDIEVLDLCIEGAKENVANFRRIIVVSAEKYTDNAEWFDENDYPFSLRDVAHELIDNDNKAEKYLKYGGRVGWYFQQLLKLYAHLVIPGLSANVLILDADTIFLKPVSFLNEQNGGLYATASSMHPPYFKHMKKLIPDFGPVYENVSGIAHHMLFQKAIILDLLQTIEGIHQIEAWKILCRLVDNKSLYYSGFSEYEIYFNFVFSQTDQIEIRPLNFRDIARLKDIPYWKKQGYDFVSCHSYMRE